ncbi:MAG TPA: aldehyde dehydrogenase family protein [Actinomycetota bacterium]|jgi:acyl-CoA reductase-like NAD-dependent aldehyde dehydrogenase|nr:aldehyde dehydrogenase family protein [Actinomycetota bacterium]
MADALQNFIDGKWVDAIDGGRFDVFNPATGEVIATAPDSQPVDVERAVDAARRTFDDGAWWPATSERDRGRILLRAAEIVRREAERLAHLESVDSGKPIGEAREDVAEVAFMFEYYGGWATKIYGEIPPVGPDAMSLVVKEPVGVAAAITPWNYPMMMAVQKVAPAIAAGCTIILKPPEQTPLTALEIPKILEEAGLPAGVLHVLTGFGETAGAPLVANPRVDKVGFTGSRDVGKIIMRSGAETLKRVTLELGGKSPNIVFADADFDAAVEGSCNGIFWNQGEICSAGSRVFVQREIYDDALHAMVDRAKQVKLGDGLAADTTMGPLISKEQQERVKEYIDIGATEARLAVQGDSPSDPKLAGGYFVPPTIFADVDNDARIAREEIFGPVMSVIPFSSADEVVRLSNDNEYGLAAAVWTRDIKKAMNTARALRAGIVWINDTQPAPTEAPWGGYKQSGIGRELGSQGVEDYLESKHIYVNLSE